jgi:hypothetical protein
MEQSEAGAEIDLALRGQVDLTRCTAAIGPATIDSCWPANESALQVW